MAYARAPYGQNQAASPWSAGCPPGLPQQPNQVAPQVQQMFNQPMGAFDPMSAGAWQQNQHHQQAPPQWGGPAMQQVQFVPNPAFMQQPSAQQQMRPHQMQQQRSMHQRSLSAPRSGANGPNKRPMNNNHSFGGAQQQHQQNNNRSQQNGNHQQQRMTRQQSRNANNNNNNNNQKGGQFNNNNNNNNNNQQHNRNNANRQQQQQQQKQNQSNNNNNTNDNANNHNNKQQQQQSTRKGTVKVTKVRKQNALKAKHAVGGNKVKVEKGANASKDKAAAANDSNNNNQKQSQQQPKAQSKTAERKQLKLQARKNAESLSQSKLPIAKTTSAKSENAGTGDEPIDQAQLKCVPAVFGFVCKLCDVFLRDKVARREHIDSEDHMEKFRAFEESEKAKAAEEAAKAEAESAASDQNTDVKTECESNQVVDGDQKDESSEVKPDGDASATDADNAEANEANNEE